MNPKIKFAIVPTSSTTSTSYSSMPSESRYDSLQQKPVNDPFDHSIDSLLDMLNSPERKSNSSSGYQTTSNYSTPKATTTTSQYSSYSSSTTPVVTSSQTKASATPHNTPSYKSSSFDNDTSFDDLLNGLESPKQASKSYTSTSTSGKSSTLPHPNSTSSVNIGAANLTVISSSTPSDGGKTRYRDHISHTI
jgi:hypothetical protein